MNQCILLAQEAACRGNLGVGALIVRNDKLVSKGLEELPRSLDLTAHAEILAIKHACQELNTKDLSDCMLYTTAEPCWMCSYVIREAKIRKVVYGTPSLEVGGANTLHPLLLISNTAPGHWGEPPEVVGRVLPNRCEKLRQMGGHPG